MAAASSFNFKSLLRFPFSSLVWSNSFWSLAFSLLLCSTCSYSTRKDTGCLQRAMFVFRKKEKNIDFFSTLCVQYLCCNNQEVCIIWTAFSALLFCVFETEWSTGSSHLASTVDIAELVKLNHILWQVVFWRNKTRKKHSHQILIDFLAMFSLLFSFLIL